MQSIYLLYNIPGLNPVIFAVDGFNIVDDSFNTGNADGDAVWNKIYEITFFLTLNLTL